MPISRVQAMHDVRPNGGWRRPGARQENWVARAVLSVVLLGLPLGSAAPSSAEDPPARRDGRPAHTGALLPRPPIVPGQVELGKLESAYVGALRVLAAGDRSRAMQAVIAIEIGESGGSATRDAERLQRTAQSLAVRMAELNGESLVPVMVMRHDLVQEYRQRGNALLSLVAGNLAMAGADLYVDVTRTSESRTLAGGLVASLAGDAQQGGSLQTAKQLFERALLLDQSSAAAMLGLGAHWELLGRYDLAAASFSRLRGDRPEDVEGALRLGVNLVRLKRFAHGIPLLRKCMDGPVDEWIAVVAAEELARALVATGKLGQATEVLERSIQRFPGEASLRVQLAFVLDTANNPIAARAAIENMGAPSGAARVSPRLRYCRWPSDALGAVRADLARAAAERGEALAQVLTAFAVEGA